MKGNKNVRSIFDNFDVSDSQDIYLQRCGFAVAGQPPPDSDPTVGVGVSPPPVNDGVASQRDADSELESLIGSGYNQDLVESQTIRFVSPPETVDTVDLEEDDVADPTVEIVSEKKQSDVPMESKVNESSSSDRRKKLNIPLRDVVKAIVMNSRNSEETEYKEIENMSCVQILLKKGFKF